MTAALKRFTPAVPRGFLAPLAALLWGGVGVMLLRRACEWFPDLTPAQAAVSAAFGLLMAGGMIPRVFRRLVAKNLARFDALPERACVFAVFAWRSWGVALVMSVLGVSLRNSDLSRAYLVGPYLGMGLCLFSGAIRYGQAVRSRAH